MSTKRAANIAYIVGIVVLVGFGIFTWWVQQDVYPKIAGVNQLAAFMYIVLGYGAVILAVSALGFKIRASLKYVAGIIVLTGFGVFTWYAEAYISPQLGIFFGFALAYMAAVLALIYILGRYGG
jgi:phosphoglycerol transferase MdoB-like AlkP superfamily enzyme